MQCDRDRAIVDTVSGSGGGSTIAPLQKFMDGSYYANRGMKDVLIYNATVSVQYNPHLKWLVSHYDLPTGRTTWHRF